jgi:hypothetical protein
MKPRGLDMDFIRLKDKYIKEIRDSLKLKSTYQIDDSLLEELDAYLSVAKSLKGKIRKIPYGVNGPEDLKIIGMLFSRTQSYKDRVREIDIKFLELLGAFRVLKKGAVEYLWNMYGGELSDLKPVARQQIFIDGVLSDIDEFVAKAEMVREKAQIIIQNLTDSHFTLKEISAIAVMFTPRDIVRSPRNI